MKKKIHCTSCGRYCGEIRDASLLKGLRFMCGPCDLNRGLDADNSDLVGKVLGSLIHKSDSRSTELGDL